MVSKEGMCLYPERNEVIIKLTQPCRKKMMLFIGKINFVGLFISSSIEMVNCLQHMIKKNVEFKWGVKEKESVSLIK